MSEFKLYDASQVTVILANVPIDSGYAEGKFLGIAQSSPDYVVVVGTDGSVTRCRTNNRHAVIKLMLLQTSSGNTLLTALSNFGLLSHNGADIGSMLIRDRLSGVCMFTAANCWISAPPEVDFDLKATSREWTFEVDALVRVDAGS
jgi:hypothetical protein